MTHRDDPPRDDVTLNPAIEWKAENGSTRGTIVVTVGPGDQMVDQLTITSEPKRLAFVDKIIARWPGLEEGRDDILRQIEDIAVKAATGPGPARTDDDKVAKRVFDALVESGVDLFHDAGSGEDARAFVSATIGGHFVTMPIDAPAAAKWIKHVAHAEMGVVLSPQSLAEIIGTLEARAVHDGPARPVGLRHAFHDDVIWLDLCDDHHRVVHIDATGWRVVDASECPVRFWRTKGMLPLPVPERGGSISLLRKRVNVRSDHDWTLLLGHVVGMFAPQGPYPILELTGEPGSAKSSTARIIRSLIDPNSAMLRSQPRCERDLFIAAGNSHVLALDNLSRMPVWLSDSLCRIATGGGHSTRKLYSNDDEQITQVCRPIILTGIEDIAARSDLLDRSLRLTLEPIPESRRRTESELKSAFAAAHPKILGAILDAVVIALKRLPTISLPRLPRMADWATWATAAEPGLRLADGAIMAAFDTDRATANIDAIEASPIGSALLVFLEQSGGEWSGTATDLLQRLNALGMPEPRGWPTSPKTLGGQLRYIAANLRAVGFIVVKDQVGHAKTRMITIRRGQAVGISGPLSASSSAGIGLHESEEARADNADDADKHCAPYSQGDGMKYWEANA